MRQRIVDYVVRNWYVIVDKGLIFKCGERLIEHESELPAWTKSPQAYEEYMLKSSSWGGLFELEVWGFINGINFKFYSYNPHVAVNKSINY